jgi:hypothetical protein
VQKKYLKSVLVIILTAFFLRGLFLVAVFPIFSGQDEARHYNTIQYLATGQSKNCINFQGDVRQVKRNLDTYRYSDEIKETVPISQTEKIRSENYNKINFRNDFNGQGEKEFKNKRPAKIQHSCPPDVAGNALVKSDFSLYHRVLSVVESGLSEQNIFIRYYVLRIISVFLGTITLLLAYKIFRLINFSGKESLLLTTAISFQPKFSIYFTNINYDSLLIFLWTSFLLLGVLILKKGWSLWRAIILFIVLWLALWTKPSALALLVMLIYLLIYQVYQVLKKRNKKNKIKFRQIFLMVVMIILLGFLLYPSLKKIGIFNLSATEYTDKITIYLKKSFSKIHGSSRNYWGGLKGDELTLRFVEIIWVLEYIAWSGLVFWQLVRLKKIRQLLNRIIGYFKESEKEIISGRCLIKFSQKYARYFYFLLFGIFSLQLAIRVADWKMFVATGKLTLGTPGRYWLPNIISHFAILVFGWKVWLNCFFSAEKRKKYMLRGLMAFVLLMILYWSYEVFIVIIPEYYL